MIYRLVARLVERCPMTTDFIWEGSVNKRIAASWSRTVI